jgi:Domain of unknown function (DUF4129)
MDDTASSSLDAARLVALYLLSFLASSSADLAWRPPRPSRLAAWVLLPGLAVVIGRFLTEALSAVGSAGVRRRARLLALVAVPLPTVLAAMVAWGFPALGPAVASALGLLQVAGLLVAEALGLELLVLWGGFLLAIVAAAGGGLLGTLALAVLLVLAAVFFALDHAVTRLTVWPGSPAPPLGRVVGDALRLVAPSVVLLGVALFVLPSSPSVTGRPLARTAPLPLPAPGSAPDLHRAYSWLTLLALAGVVTLVLVFRWLRGRGKGARPLVEMAVSHVEAEEILEARAPGDPRYAAARGRVIRAYLRFLGRAREAGFRLDLSLTPREIEGRVRRPEAPLDLLTGLFMDARYGPDEPGPEGVRQAEAASRAVCAGLPRRRSRRAPLPDLP